MHNFFFTTRNMESLTSYWKFNILNKYVHRCRCAAKSLQLKEKVPSFTHGHPTRYMAIVKALSAEIMLRIMKLPWVYHLNKHCNWETLQACQDWSAKIKHAGLVISAPKYRSEFYRRLQFFAWNARYCYIHFEQ